jgi:nitrogen regulatory protein P-II 1
MTTANGTENHAGALPVTGDDEAGASRMIVAIVQRGKADRPIKAALKAGARSAVACYGRGLGIRERLGLLGLAVQPEKEIVLVIVPAALTDLVVRVMVRAGDLDQPGVGFLFVVPVEEIVTLGGASAVA